MRSRNRIVVFGLLAALVGSVVVVIASTSGEVPAFSWLRGHFLLEVQAQGKGWYVMPDNGTRVYLGAPREALARLRAIGIPVSSETIERIPQAGSVFAHVAGGKLNQTSKKYLGSILVRADSAPYDAWYVNPAEGIRYPLATPYDAWHLIATQAIGIAENDIEAIPLGTLEEDVHPIVFEKLTRSQTTLIPGRTAEKVSRDTIARLDAFARDPSTRELLPDGYIFLTIHNTLALISPRYGRWFIIASQEGDDSFRMIDVLSGSGTYYPIDDKSDKPDGDVRLTGLYTQAEPEQQNPVFLIQRGARIGTLAIGIVATETLYQTIDAQGIHSLSTWRSPIFSGSLIKSSDSLYATTRANELVRISGADLATLQLWMTRDGSTVLGDSYGLYATDNVGDAYRVPVSDPSTVTVRFNARNTVAALDDSSGSFYVDAQNGRIHRATPWDEGSVRRIAEGIIEKDGGVYIESAHAKSPIQLEGVLAASFFALPESEGALYSDGRTIYYRAEGNPSPHLLPISPLDTESFEYLARTAEGILVKDRLGVYGISSDTGAITRVSDADAQSFRTVYADGTTVIAKDNYRVFSGNPLRAVPEADGASFHIAFTIEGIPFGRDRAHIFYALPGGAEPLRMLEGADPQTFDIRELPTIEPALRTLAVKGTERVIYATDRNLIWFYDGGKDNLLVIQRADPTEPLTREQILEFARTYARFAP